MQFFPYLNFNGNCREALTFYAELFGGTVDGFIPWTAEILEQMPASEATEEHVMHGSIKVNDYTIAAQMCLTI